MKDISLELGLLFDEIFETILLKNVLILVTDSSWISEVMAMAHGLT